MSPKFQALDTLTSTAASLVEFLHAYNAWEDRKKELNESIAEWETDAKNSIVYYGSNDGNAMLFDRQRRIREARQQLSVADVMLGDLRTRVDRQLDIVDKNLTLTGDLERDTWRALHATVTQADLRSPRYRRYATDAANEFLATLSKDPNVLPWLQWRGYNKLGPPAGNLAHWWEGLAPDWKGAVGATSNPWLGGLVPTAAERVNPTMANPNWAKAGWAALFAAGAVGLNEGQKKKPAEGVLPSGRPLTVGEMIPTPDRTVTPDKVVDGKVRTFTEVSRVALREYARAANGDADPRLEPLLDATYTVGNSDVGGFERQAPFGYTVNRVGSKDVYKLAPNNGVKILDKDNRFIPALTPFVIGSDGKPVMTNEQGEPVKNSNRVIDVPKPAKLQSAATAGPHLAQLTTDGASDLAAPIDDLVLAGLLGGGTPGDAFDLAALLRSADIAGGVQTDAPVVADVGELVGAGV